MEVIDISGDGNDVAKYVSGLSTLPVATIEEAKDRISQIEYIFCRQLYRNFQKSSKSMQKLYSEARKAAEEKCQLEFETKEKDLRLVMEKALEDCNVLKGEKLKLLTRMDEVEEMLLMKMKEAADGMELHGKLLREIKTKENQVKEDEELVIALDKEQFEEKKLSKELLMKIASGEMEKNQLRMELGNVAASVDDLRRKSSELEEGNKLREKLVREVDWNGVELENMDQQLRRHEGEKKLLMSRISDLENKVKVLEENLKGGSESHDDLLQQIELKNGELAAAERHKNISPAAAHWTSNRKPVSTTGTKSSASRWRDTRSHQGPGGHDPHHDFLDTPYENIRGNLHKANKDFGPPEIPAQVSNDESDEDATQDMQAESSSKKQQLQAAMPGSKGYKYVEPVRKKSERENLNGIECKQCKKFYDAILADGKEGEVDQRNFRCEHHDGVSRHRYRIMSSNNETTPPTSIKKTRVKTRQRAIAEEKEGDLKQRQAAREYISIEDEPYDILTQAINKPEHPDRSRGLGFGVSIKNHFHSNKYCSIQDMEQMRGEIQMMRKELEELKSQRAQQSHDSQTPQFHQSAQVHQSTHFHQSPHFYQSPQFHQSPHFHQSPFFHQSPQHQ